MSRVRLGKLVVTKILNSGGKSGQAGKAQGNVIVLHGTCDSGSGMRDWLKSISKTEFRFPKYQVLYPSAPAQKYTLHNGQESTVWFDRFSLGPDMPEDKASLDQSAAELTSFLKDESERSGISLEKTIIGGFSSGGIMALHMGFRFHPQLAGVFTLSSFLPSDSYVYENLDNHGEKEVPNSPKCHKCHQPSQQSVSRSKKPRLQKKLPRLFMSQGQRDPLVHYNWGKATHKKLLECGVEGHFFTVPNAEHGIVSSQLNVLHDWIQKTLEDEPQGKSKNGGRKKHHVNDECCIPASD